MHGGVRRHADLRAFDHAAQSLGITAFADENHVRSSARGVSRGLEEGRQMFGNGGLRNRAADIGHGIELKFDGRLVGADIAPALFDDVSQYGGQKRGLAAAHDSSDQHETVGGSRVVENLLFDTKVFQRRRHGGNGAEGDFYTGAVAFRHGHGVAAKTLATASRLLDFIGKVVVGLTGEKHCRHGVVARDFFQYRNQLIGTDGAARDLLPFAVEPHPCRFAGTEAEVGHPELGSPEQKFIDGRTVPADDRFVRVKGH